MHDLELIKRNYPQPDKSAYFNTSSTGLISKTGVRKVARFNKDLLRFGSKYAEAFYLEGIPKIRKTISRFIDASVDEIALVPNFSYGLNAVLPSIARLRSVLLYREDYPSLTIPFELNDFEIYWIENKDGFFIDLNELKQTVSQHKIDIIAISHIQYLTGFTIDIEELASFCNLNDVLLIVDGTQSLGAMDYSFNKSGVHIFIASNYKWMNSGFGTGIMCIDKSTLNKFTPKIGGYNSLKYLDQSWKYISSIHSYEPGHHNMAGLVMLEDAIEFKLRLGLGNIADYNRHLLNIVTDKLNEINVGTSGSSADNDHRSNIIGIPGDKSLATYLQDNNVVVKWRNGIIRVGIHFYNTESDIMRLVRHLESYRRTNPEYGKSSY
ncbi:MAG: aminotransferase class V-fold PLP-dependent enzyme [Cytophagales bacterium]|nr:aminotransferase class V-fold PLP-dependent enzyme [Cytophagales bacterium]